MWFGFPFSYSLRQRQQGKLILKDKPKTVVEIVLQPPPSFPFFREQSLWHSDTGAAAQEPPQGSVVPPWQLPRHHPSPGTSPSLPIAATRPHQARAAFPVSTGDAAGAMNVQGKAGMIPAVKWTMGFCYHHAVFPSNFTGTHVCTELSLKMLKTKLWEAYWKVCQALQTIQVLPSHF